MTIAGKKRTSSRTVSAFVLITSIALAAITRASPPAAAATPDATTSIEETAQPALVKLLPPGIVASKTLTVAVALGSPPDDFRNDKGEIAGWEIDILRAVRQRLGL